MRLFIIKEERESTYHLTFRHGDNIPEIVGYAVIPKRGNSILRAGQLEIIKQHYDFHSVVVRFRNGYVHFFVEH